MCALAGDPFIVTPNKLTLLNVLNNSGLVNAYHEVDGPFDTPFDGNSEDQHGEKVSNKDVGRNEGDKEPDTRSRGNPSVWKSFQDDVHRSSVFFGTDEIQLGRVEVGLSV